MRGRGLQALQPQAFTPRTTDATHDLCCAPNRLLNQPKPTQATRASKQVVGWLVMATMPAERITTALQRASRAQPPTPGVLVHSARGGQYWGSAYRKLRPGHQALRSQSRRGDWYDKALAESRWSRRKTEVLEVRERPVFADLAKAPASVADHFDYYNHARLPFGIDYQTP